MDAIIRDLRIHVPGNVKIPARLNRALENGRVAVFVGAGASLDPPSSLPTFEGLTEDVLRLAGSKESPDADKRFDAQLGDLADDGFDVHKAVRSILDKPDSKLNHWHLAVAGLFQSADACRIVTTNYDLHLDAALGPDARVWCAPALPLGSEFNGVVHLHGSLDGNDEGLVVTDAEFGRAYLTEGWARRFVMSLFQSYDVLFVGYSHDDVVMQYVARGLPRDSADRRFALVSAEADPTKWQRLRITPITWDPEPGDQFGPGARALAAWGERTWWTNLEHERHITSLIAGGPLLDPTDESYLRRALDHPVRTNSFLRRADPNTWLPWLKKQYAFARLFDPGLEAEKPDTLLARWFAENVVLENPDLGLELLAEMGGKVSPVLWQAIGQYLAFHEASYERLHPWLMVLCNSDAEIDFQALHWILEKCKLPEDAVAIMTILRALFEPRPVLSAGISVPGHIAAPHLTIRVGCDWNVLEKVLEKSIAPEITTIGPELYAFGLDTITKYHTTQYVFQSGWDLSAERSAIEADPRDRLNSPHVRIVDLTRVAAEHMATTIGATSVAADLTQRNIPILTRLATWLIGRAK